MSRESRTLLQEMERMASEHNITAIITTQQVYAADQVILKYYTAPILNAIKSKVRGLKKVSSKHFNIEHWISVLDSMFGNNQSVRRDNSPVILVDSSDNGFGGFGLISKFLITDYGLQDAEMIYRIVHQYDTDMISEAIKISSNAKVNNIRYANAVLENMQAKSNIRKHEVEVLRERADSAKNILNRETIQHSTIDMATAQYEWQRQKENFELERKMQEKFGE